MIEPLIKLKIPTLTLLAIMYYFGIKLITSTEEGIIELTAGFLIICGAVVLSFVAFLDYRHKESTDNAISQMDKVIISLNKALAASAKTNLESEKIRQETIKFNPNSTIGKQGKNQYSLMNENKDEETATQME